jgi:hypothetical protein
MAQLDIELLKAIPFFDHAELNGRFVCSMLFFDGEWHAWVTAGDQIIKMQMWPAETIYFGTRAERATDISLHFLNLIAQRLNHCPVGKQLFALQADICNLAASLAKIELIHRSRKEIPSGVSRMVATDVEYIHSVCRSIFDLWQEVLAGLWEGILRRKRRDQETAAQEVLCRYAIFCRHAANKRGVNRTVWHPAGPREVLRSQLGLFRRPAQVPGPGRSFWGAAAHDIQRR